MFKSYGIELVSYFFAVREIFLCVSGAHHTDLRSATKEDPEWLIEQRKQEADIIQIWIHQYYADLEKW